MRPYRIGNQRAVGRIGHSEITNISGDVLPALSFSRDAYIGLELDMIPGFRRFWPDFNDIRMGFHKCWTWI